MSRLAKVLLDFGQIFRKEIISPFLEAKAGGRSSSSDGFGDTVPIEGAAVGLTESRDPHS